MRERIKVIIDKEGMSQGQFADFIGVNRPTLSHILAGRNNPSMEVVMKIHQAFPRINVVWLLDGKGTYEGDAIEDYPEESLLEDKFADKVDNYPHDNNEERRYEPRYRTSSEEHKDSQLKKAGFYQGDLFAENAIIPPKRTRNEKERKETVLHTPKKVPYSIEILEEKTQRKMQRKIIEIKIFYDDGTYETFKQ